MKTGITLALAAVSALGGSSILSGGHVPFINTGYVPPAQCVEWYNGCNMCDKTADGQAVCTNRLCNTQGKGFCRSYATSTAATQ